MTTIKPSVFKDKAIQPSLLDVEKSLPGSFPHWKILIDFIYENYPDIKEEWTYSGKNYGWSFRLRSKKRVVMYFSPLQDCLRVGFALGQAATDAILSHSMVPSEIKIELMEAKAYREGRGLRIEVFTNDMIPIIKEIVVIKMNN